MQVLLTVWSNVILAPVQKLCDFILDPIANKINQFLTILLKSRFSHQNMVKIQWLFQNISMRHLLNICVLNFCLVWFYEYSRIFAKFIYGNNQKQGELHAIWLYKIENELLGIFWEYDLQQLFVDSYKWQKFFWIIYYKFHVGMTLAIYYPAIFFASRKKYIFQFYFYSFWTSCMLAVFVYSLFPCAPPRLIPEVSQISDSFHDVLHQHICDALKNHNGWANCYAAVPSVHIIWCTYTCVMGLYHCVWYINHIPNEYLLTHPFILQSVVGDDGDGNGTATLCCCSFPKKKKMMMCLIRLSKLSAKVLIVWFIIYYFLMHLTIIVSGHHWILDIVASDLIMVPVCYGFYKYYYGANTANNNSKNTANTDARNDDHDPIIDNSGIGSKIKQNQIAADPSEEFVLLSMSDGSETSNRSL